MLPDDELAALQARIRLCRQCAEAGYEIGSSPVVSGQAGARVMLIGQAPGQVEDRIHRPFSGPAGKRLFAWLRQAGWEEEEFRALAYMTAVTKCYPGKGKGGRGDRVATPAERALCRPWLDQELALVHPEVLILVGKLAIGLFYPPSVPLAELIGTVEQRELFPGRRKTWVVPLPHPSGASLWINQAENQERLRRAQAILRQLKAVSLTDST